MNCKVKNDWWWHQHGGLHTQSHSIFSTHYQSGGDRAGSCVGAYQSRRDIATVFNPLEILGQGGARRKPWACFHESQQPKIASVWSWYSWVSAAALKSLQGKKWISLNLVSAWTHHPAWGFPSDFIEFATFYRKPEPCCDGYWFLCTFLCSIIPRWELQNRVVDTP